MRDILLSLLHTWFFIWWCKKIKNKQHKKPSIGLPVVQLHS